MYVLRYKGVSREVQQERNYVLCFFSVPLLLLIPVLQLAFHNPFTEKQLFYAKSNKFSILVHFLLFLYDAKTVIRRAALRLHPFFCILFLHPKQRIESELKRKLSHCVAFIQAITMLSGLFFL
jgi:hypothetical protein